MTRNAVGGHVAPGVALNVGGGGEKLEGAVAGVG